jgi:hypothetical protein
MKRGSVVAVAVIALLMLGACSGHERSTLTGSYGSGVVTGEVVMSQGVSPAGVEVSVRGTGMAMQLGADGQFAFAGVPEGAELLFRRASDGIEATLQLEKASGHLVVDLAQTTAKKGRRRAAGSKTIELEGLVRSANATELVLDTARQSGITVALTPQTLIRHGGTSLTAADLIAGTRVHVKAAQVSDTLTALSVTVQDDADDDNRPSAREFEGAVVSASATQLVILDSHQQQVTFVIDASTVIRKGNTPVLAADIQAGWRVHVKSTAAVDGTKTAHLVIVQRTDSGDDDGNDHGEGQVKLSGAVTAVGGSELTLQSGAASVIVKTDATTHIEKRDHIITLADIHAGDTVKVEGTRNIDGSVLAKEIEVKSK